MGYQTPVFGFWMGVIGVGPLDPRMSLAKVAGFPPSAWIFIWILVLREILILTTKLECRLSIHKDILVIDREKSLFVI
jgi:hypothetical protein